MSFYAKTNAKTFGKHFRGTTLAKSYSQSPKQCLSGLLGSPGAIRRYRVFAEFSRHFCSARSGDARLAHSEKLARVPEKVHTRLGNVPRDPHTTFGGHMTLHVESRGLILPQSKTDYI